MPHKDRKKYCRDNREKINEYMRGYYKNNREKENRRKGRWRIKQWGMVIEGYGGRCLFCEEDRPKTLVLHHVNNDGIKHRKEVGRGMQLHRWIIRNDFPDEIVLLCANCHLILHKIREVK